MALMLRPSKGPATCAAVTWDMGDGSYGNVHPYDERVGIGSLLWNPKMGEGHVIVRAGTCGKDGDCGCGGWLGPCSSRLLICECGEDDSYRDHHYEVLAIR